MAGTSQLCGAITSCSNLRSGRGLKQSCSSRRNLSNGVSHDIYTHGSRVDSRHFVVGSQTISLTPGLSFCHNLCYKCPNGSCELILDIYTSIYFQWYKKLFNARCFDLCDYSLKVQESTRTPTPQNGSSLGSASLHPHILSHSSWAAPLCKPLPWSRAQG
jgi:hypothetical protein